MAEGLPNRDPFVGRSLADCVLEERIGRGGMGSVYKAHRKPDDLAVAIKILAPFMATDPAVVARFTREARAAARIQHPNVVRVLGSAIEDGTHFTIMEFVDGENLSELLKREGRLSTGRAAAIAGEVAQGLRALHHEGIIHRDVKPSNILIGRNGAVKITDFGIARDVLEIQRLTATGDLLGTLGFAAPEQLNQSEVDARADLYSLGVTLRTMLTGVRPSANPRIPAPPLDPSVPQDLRELVRRLLADNPSDRPENAASVAAVLSPYAKRSGGRSLATRTLRVGLKIVGGLLAFGAGVAAASSHGPGYQADPWSLVIPARDALASSGALFGLGVLFAFWAFIRGQDQMGLGIRRFFGSSLLAASLVIAYMAGAAVGTFTFEEAARSLVSPSPEVLFAEALAAAAIGLFVGMRRPARVFSKLIGGSFVLLALGAAATASSAASLTQSMSDLRVALSRGTWAWMSFLLAGLGVAVSFRRGGSLSRLFLAPLAVFGSLGLVYWSTLGEGSPPLERALAAPGGELALAILLALGAKAARDLRPEREDSSHCAPEGDSRGSSVTPPPIA